MTGPVLPPGNEPKAPLMPDPQPGPLALGDDHARALTLAAQRPTEALGPVDAGWLDAHLTGCDSCAATAAGYEADRLLLRGLRDRSPQPPRDLWARTSLALEREAGRPVRIRRAGAPARPPAPYRPPRWSPGILAGLLVVTIVAGSSLLSGLGKSFFPSPSGTGAAATPIAVSADVRWIQTGTNGSFEIVLGQVDRVCPPTDPGSCGPLQDVSRASISLGAAPRSVSLSPATGQLVVVASNGTSGGTVFVVPVPSSLARPSPAPGASGSPVTLASTIPGASGSPAASAALASPAASGAIAIAENVIVVGGTAGYSPDGQWFAFAARPADGSTGPDIYAWRVGDLRARPITTDHRSIFSGWLGQRILGSRVDDGAVAVTPTGSASPGVSASPGGSASPGASAASRTPQPSPAPSSTSTPTTPAPTATTQGADAPNVSPIPTASASPTRSATPSTSPSPSGAVVPSGSAIASIRPGFIVATERGVTSFLLDPATGVTEDLVATRSLRPVVDPTGTWVVSWEGTVVSDRQGVDWIPGTGRLVVAPWTGPTPTGPTAGGATPAPGASPAASASASASPAASAVATGTPAATASGTLRPSASPSLAPAPSATPRTSATPRGSGAGPASPSGSPDASAAPAAPTGPQPLIDGPMLDFDAAFDPTGTHLAIWVANPSDPGAGTLTLFTLKDGTWSVDPQHRLVGVPALRGFSIAEGELVWVTPPDAKGQGSRIEVAGWTREGFGSVQSVAGGGLIVIR